MKVGDVITAVGDNDALDAFGLATELVTAQGTVTLTLRRGDKRRCRNRPGAIDAGRFETNSVTHLRDGR